MSNFLWPNKPVRVYDCNKLVQNLSKDWVVQPKMDGKRILPSMKSGKLTLYGRQEQVFNTSLAGTIEFGSGDYLLDGELMRDGSVYLWDYAIYNGKPEYHLPYAERLQKLRAELKVSGKVFLVETLPADQYQTFLARGKTKLEGCVWKNLSASKDYWGLYSTTEVACQFKYRL